MSTNSGAGTRAPPRYVPTLTEVVDVAEGLLPRNPVEEAGQTAGLSRPTFSAPVTAVPSAQNDIHRADALLWPVAPQPLQQWSAGHQADAAPEAIQTWPTPDLMEALGVLITEQVMQRLEQRLATLVDQHASQLAEQLARNLTDALSRQLQAEVPDLVQQAMALAVDPKGQSGDGFAHQRGFSPIYGADGDSG